jgi:hypothetical protein
MVILLKQSKGHFKKLIFILGVKSNLVNSGLD